MNEASKGTIQVEKFIITNVFPFSLVRRKIVAWPIAMDEVKRAVRSVPFASAWGHQNTLSVINELLGVDITPPEPRPAIILDEKKFPTLYGEKFTKVMLVSPNFRKGFRPAIGEEVSKEAILGWQALFIDFEPEELDP